MYRQLASILAHMLLRKVLRIHEHGVSNEAVLQRAQISIEAYITRELDCKRQSLQHDSFRCDSLRNEALQQLDWQCDSIKKASTRSSSASVSIVSGCEVACVVCGISYVNREALNAHVTSRHPDIHQQARRTFDRLRHALHGLPICRLCRKQRYDWISLERHVTEGRCERLKPAAAHKLQEAQIIAEVEREEEIDPPAPPASLPAVMPFLEQFRHLLHRRRSMTLSIMRQLFFPCVTGCNQKFTSGLRVHWQKIHKVEWEWVHGEIEAILGSLSSVFQTPCQFCGSKATDGKYRSTKHAHKWPALFQALAVQTLHRADRLPAALTANRGPSLKQSEKQPLYMTQSTLQQLLHFVPRS